MAPNINMLCAYCDTRVSGVALHVVVGGFYVGLHCNPHMTPSLLLKLGLSRTRVCRRLRRRLFQCSASVSLESDEKEPKPWTVKIF